MAELDRLTHHIAFPFNPSLDLFKQFVDGHYMCIYLKTEKSIIQETVKTGG